MTEPSPRRRAIPTDRRGVKDDWKAMRSHLETINNNAARQEQQLIASVRQEYNKELANEVAEKQHRHMSNARNEKEADATQVRAKVMDYQKSMAMQRERQVKMKSDLSTSYDRAMDHKNAQRVSQFQNDRQQEKARLEQVRRSMEEEEKFRRMRKNEQVQSEQAVFKEKQIRKLHNKLQTEKEKVVDARNAVDDQRRYLEQQRNYVQFYQDKDHKQQRLMSNYSKTVLATERQRQDKMREMKDVQDHRYREQELNRLAQERARKDMELKRRNETLAMQIDIKSRVKEEEKHTYVKGIDERRQKESADQSFNNMMMKDRLEKQRMYKSILDKQKEVTDKIRSEESRMTHSERKVNRQEMQSFKNGGSEGGHSMIPGFGFSNHLKTMRGSGSQPNLRHFSSSGFSSPKDRSQGFNNSSISFSPVNKEKSEMKKRQRVAEMNQVSVSLNKSVFPNPNTDKYDASYNPITNPIPNYNQNPYMSRQGQSMLGVSKGTFFARQASNSILG